MADDSNPSRTRAGAGVKSNPVLDAIKSTAATLNVSVPVTQMTADLNQRKEEVQPSTVLWVGVD